MKIHTYFDYRCSDLPREIGVIALWIDSWRSAGWETVILNQYHGKDLHDAMMKFGPGWYCNRRTINVGGYKPFSPSRFTVLCADDPQAIYWAGKEDHKILSDPTSKAYEAIWNMAQIVHAAEVYNPEAAIITPLLRFPDPLSAPVMRDEIVKITTKTKQKNDTTDSV